MFTFDTVIDTAVKGAKSTLSHVQDKDVRKSLETVVDANAKFAQTVYDANLELAKLVVEKFSTNAYTKPFAEAAKKFTAEAK